MADGPQLIATVPDKFIEGLDQTTLPEVVRNIIHKEGNLIPLYTRGFKDATDRLRSQREMLVEARLLREEMGEIEKAEHATAIIRDLQRENDGLQRRLTTREKRSLAATAEPATAVHSTD